MIVFCPNYGFESVKNALHAAWMWAFGMRFHSRRSADFNASILRYFLVTLLFKMPQIEKFNGFAFGEFAGHCVEEMKCGTLFFSHFWLTSALWDGAESCWNVHGRRPKCLHAQGFNTASTTVSRYMVAFILTPRSKNTSGERSSAVTAA